MSTDVDYMIEQINEKLIGATVTAAAKSVDNESFGLQMQLKGITFVAWVDCDAEGNGPGWLSITK